MRRKSGVEKKMQITYQNEWEYTNIHVDLPIPYEEDYQIKMIHYNKIKGMLPVQGIGRDGQSRYTFRLENGMSMDKIYEEAEISGKEIEDFMEQLSVITEQIKIFFLNNNHIILDPKLIFKKAEQYYFCYLPIIKKENEPTMCEAFHELTEYFVKHLDYKDTEGVFLVSKIHRETLKENYDLKKVIETCKKDVKKQKQAEKQKRIRKIEEKKKRDEAQENISEKAIFSPAEERISTDKISEICKEEQIYMKESTVKKVINRIKGDRWGKWDDLITEMGGHSTSGIL